MIQNPYYQYTDVDGDTLKFSLDCGADTGRLDIDSSTGLLSFSTDYDLDIVGTSSKIDCKVYITDDEYTDMAYVNITILDDNDNSPVFIYSEYTFYIPVTSSVGSFVGQVQAIDKDIGNYGKSIIQLQCMFIGFSLPFSFICLCSSFSLHSMLFRFVTINALDSEDKC